MPVFLAQGTADVVVSPQITAAFKDHLCGRGVPVEFLSMPHVIHARAAHQSAAAAVAWISDRFAGVPAPSDCTPR